MTSEPRVISSVYDLIFPPQQEKDPLSIKKGIVYCIRNKITGHCYIGQTKKNFYGRYPCGEWWRTTTNRPLKDDWAKYGKESFNIMILEEDLNEEDLLRIESLYIRSYDSLYPNGYNLFYDSDPFNENKHGVVYIVNLNKKNTYVFEKDGSERKTNFYIKEAGLKSCSEETKKKISIANKGKKRTNEMKERMRNAAVGRKWEPETIEKRKASLKGKHTKAVIQINPRTGKVIKEFSSMTEATNAMGLKSSSNLTSACKGKNRQKLFGGYLFKYKK